MRKERATSEAAGDECKRQRYAELVVVVVAAMCRDLAADFAAREARRVHVRVAITSAKRAQERGEVIGIQALIGGCRIQGNDVSGSRRAGYRAGCGLRAIGFLWVGRAALRPTAEEGHHVGINAALSEVDVGKERRQLVGQRNWQIAILASLPAELLIQFRAGEYAGAAYASHHEDRPVTEACGGVRITRCIQTSGRIERSGRRVIQLRT
jgi:hypothetical protein